jgi:hypothetical protein
MTQAFNLSQLANKVNTSGQLDGATGLTGTITSSALSITGNSYLATSSGNVAVGTTATTYNYQTKNIALYDGASSGISVASGSKILTLTSQASGGCFVGTRSNDDLRFATNDIERMRIEGGGNVLINTTSNYSNTKLNIEVANQDCFGVRTNNIGAGYRYDTTQNGGVAAYFTTNTNTQFAGNISVTGTTTSYVTSSDYRLKENIAPMTGALTKVLQLKPVTYKWKVNETNGQGFIAHELQAIVPDCVIGEKDEVETYTDQEGNEQTRPKYQGVDTSFLVATLTAAIQEQQTIINDLKARIETLELK